MLASAIFNNWFDAEYTKLTLKNLKESMGWSQEREFKSHRATDGQRMIFFSEVQKCNFRIRAIVVDKTKVDKFIIRGSDSFYNIMVEELLRNFDDTGEAYVFLDGSGNRNFRKRSTAEIRRAVNNDKYKIKEFRLINSRSSVLIQLADMIAGVVGAKYDKTKRFSHDWLRMLKTQIDWIRVV